MDCRVYSSTFINFCLWAIKWTGFGFGAINDRVAQFPTWVVGTVFGPSRMNLGFFVFEIVVFGNCHTP